MELAPASIHHHPQATAITIHFVTPPIPGPVGCPSEFSSIFLLRGPPSHLKFCQFSGTADLYLALEGRIFSLTEQATKQKREGPGVNLQERRH